MCEALINFIHFNGDPKFWKINSTTKNLNLLFFSKVCIMLGLLEFYFFMTVPTKFEYETKYSFEEIFFSNSNFLVGLAHLTYTKA